MVKLVTPIQLEHNISKTAGDRDSVSREHQITNIKMPVGYKWSRDVTDDDKDKVKQSLFTRYSDVTVRQYGRIYISLFTTKVVQYMQKYKYKYKKTDNHKEDRQSR